MNCLRGGGLGALASGVTSEELATTHMVAHGTVASRTLEFVLLGRRIIPRAHAVRFRALLQGTSRSDRSSLLSFTPAPRLFSRLVREFGLCDLDLTAGVEFEDDQFRWVLQAARAEEGSLQPGSRVAAHALNTLLCVLLLRRYTKTTRRLSPRHPNKVTPARLRRVEEHIRADLARELSLKELARVAGLSTFHFARCFKQATGETPHALVTRLRVERAREMLTKSGLNVAAIAAELGFASASHFAKVFRRAMSISPAAYRRALESRNATSYSTTRARPELEQGPRAQAGAASVLR